MTDEERFKDYTTGMFILRIKQLEDEVKKLRSKTLEDYIRETVLYVQDIARSARDG